MRAIAFTLTLAAAMTLAVVADAGIYRWVDANGVVHYSDRPTEGAQKVEVQVQTYKAPPPPANATPAQPSNPGANNAPLARSCEISSPGADEALINVNTVTVGVRIEPAPLSGQFVQIYLDGRRVDGLSPTGTSFTLSPVYRGTHTVSAVLMDANGGTLCRSAAVTFHVRQPSLLAPNRRPKPR
ncbi:MAG: DUF4124 domain-containing protein [Steroidobacteraceae bacterium]